MRTCTNGEAQMRTNSGSIFEQTAQTFGVFVSVTYDSRFYRQMNEWMPLSTMRTSKRTTCVFITAYRICEPKRKKQSDGHNSWIYFCHLCQFCLNLCLWFSSHKKLSSHSIATNRRPRPIAIRLFVCIRRDIERYCSDKPFVYFAFFFFHLCSCHVCSARMRQIYI